MCILLFLHSYLNFLHLFRIKLQMEQVLLHLHVSSVAQLHSFVAQMNEISIGF